MKELLLSTKQLYRSANLCYDFNKNGFKIHINNYINSNEIDNFKRISDIKITKNNHQVIKVFNPLCVKELLLSTKQLYRSANRCYDFNKNEFKIHINNYSNSNEIDNFKRISDIKITK